MRARKRPGFITGMPADGIDKRCVFGKRLRCPPLHRQSGWAKQRQCLVERSLGLDEKPIMRSAIDGEVEGAVAAGELLRLLQPTSVALDLLGERLDFNVTCMLCGHGRGRTIQDLAHQIEFGDGLRLQCRDHHTFVWFMQKQSAGFQAPQRFSDRRAAERKRLRDVSFFEAITWSEPTIKDLLIDLFIDVGAVFHSGGSFLFAIRCQGRPNNGIDNRRSVLYPNVCKMEGQTMSDYDVIVVGAGNAAFCAAVSAREKGARVLVLECAPEEEAGGNSRFTAGAIRFAYDGVDDIRALVPDLTDEEAAITDFGTYTEDQFFDDMFRVTQYRTDPDLVEVLVRGSRSTMGWMSEKGVRFVPIYGRQAFKVDGKFKFWGGLTLEAWGGGPGLVQAWTDIAKNQGIDVWYQARAMELLSDGFSVNGVKVRLPDRIVDLKSRAVVLAAGGFQANPEWRTRYLGPGWDIAKVRGSRFNTGDGLKMAIDVGASTAGNWSGCHAVGWERNAPEFGDLAVGDNFQKHSYPFGIMINANGERFLDEGADFRNYTYAKYGRVILEQPGSFAWQIFDQKVVHLLRDEYRIKQVTKVQSDTLDGLLEQLEGVNAQAAKAEIAAYNDAVRTDVPFNPNVKDGRSTNGLKVPKSNWSNTIDEGPFEAYAVTCGVTFTFGGVRIDTSARVLSTDYQPIPGLTAAGEMVGGIFYHNYPGGSGLINGAVFGKIAGESAADFAVGN